jgi:hypothetical protein
MKTVAELLYSYTEQARLDTEDILELLLEFCAETGMNDAAVAAVSERIEEEGAVEQLQAFLVERGLFETLAKPGDGEQLLGYAADDGLDLDEDDLE